MTVYELARELGSKLLESEEGKRMADARYVFDGNPEAQQLLFNYSDYSNAVKQKYADGILNDEDLEREKLKLAEMMEELKANSIIMDMLDAETQFSMLVNQVMTIINSTVSGDEGGCSSCSSGGCAGCSGCH